MVLHTFYTTVAQIDCWDRAGRVIYRLVEFEFLFLRSDMISDHNNAKEAHRIACSGFMGEWGSIMVSPTTDFWLQAGRDGFRT